MGKRSTLPNYYKQNRSNILNIRNSFFALLKKLWVFMIAFILIAGIGAGVFLSQQQTNTQQHASGNAWEGNAIYDSCGTSCLSHLDELHEAGFTAVLDYIIFGWTNPDAIQAYAQRAQQDNIKIIWSIKDFYTSRGGANPGSSTEYNWVTSNCNCNDWNSAAAYLVNLVKNDPATWGYYIADEPSSKNNPLSAGQVASLSNTIHNADPYHPRLIVNDDSLDTNSANAASNLATFQSSADVLAEDFYPVSFGLNINIVKDVMNETQYIANTYGRKSAIVLELNSDWPTYPATNLPSLSQMESMYNQARNGYSSNNPDLVIWYSFVKTPDSQFGNLIQAIHQGSMYGTCANQPLDFCTTDQSFGVMQYTGKAAGSACAIAATDANAPRGETIYCCKTGKAQYGGCTGSGGQGVCVTSCPTSDIYYTDTAAGDACSIAVTKAGVARNTPVYCSCASGNCPNSPTAVPTVAPTTIPPTATPIPPTVTPNPTSIPTQEPTETPPLTKSPSVPEDINGDGRVDVIDYELLVACYGEKFHTSSCVAGSKADIDGDGVVDGIDYNLWLRAFLSQEGL